MASVVLHDQFKGAIAGAILGYLTGLHYQRLYSADQSSTSDASLDLTWLAPASADNHQQTPPSSFKPNSKISKDRRGLSGAFLSMPFLSGMDVSEAMPPDPVSTSSNTIFPILCLLEQLEALLDNPWLSSPHPAAEHPASAHFTRLSAVEPYGKSMDEPSQASFILLPFLMFHYDNPLFQKDGIQDFLRCWQCPKEWHPPLQAVGFALAQTMGQAMGQTMGQAMGQKQALATPRQVDDYRLESPELETSGPSLDVLSLWGSCAASVSMPICYQASLLSYIHQGIEQQLETLPWVAGLTGALLGGRGGFNCLPLIWRYLFNQYLRVSPSQSEYEPVLDWDIKMAGLWSGVHTYCKSSNEGPNATMAARTARCPTVSLPQRR